MWSRPVAERRALLAACAGLAALLCAGGALAQSQAPGTLPLVVGAGPGGTSYSVPIQTLLFFTALSFLPAVLLMMTGFTRIVIVLSLLRQAIGTQQAPPNQVVVGLSLFLTLFVMGPTLDKVYQEAYVPYTTNALSFEQAVEKAEAPMRAFMLKQTRQFRLRAVRPPGQAGARGDGRDRAAARAGARLRDERAQDRVPDRLHGLHPVPHHRHGGLQRAHVPRDDDALAGARGAAVQAHAVRAGRRVEPLDRLARGELRDLT
jgi:hypothetical protein